MNLLIDFQACQSKTRCRGIGRYTFGFLKGMASIGALSTATLHVNASLGKKDDPFLQELISLSPSTRVVMQEYLPMDGTAEEREENRKRNTLKLAFLMKDYEGLLLSDPMEAGFNSFTPNDRELFADKWFCSIVHDFIPLIFCDIYLKDEFKKFFYHKKLNLIRQSDFLLSNSQSTRSDAIALLGISPKKIANIDGGCDDFSVPENDSKPVLQLLHIDRPFMMYVANADYRKNVTGLLQAYSLLPVRLQEQYQLVIVHGESEEERHSHDTFLEKARELGIPFQNLVLIGHIPDDVLAILYSEASLFVFASFYEGLGFPALEAIRCGTPVIAGNNSSLEEIVGREDALFDAFDAEDIAQKIVFALTHEEWRRELLTWQSKHIEKFSWEHTARIASEAMESNYKEFFSKRERVRCRTPASHKPRLAYFSPLPPQPTGIADYSRHLLPHLSTAFSIDLVADENYQVDNDDLRSNYDILTLSKFEATDERHSYDHYLYHIGNSPLHTYMLPALVKHGGVAVLHEVYMKEWVPLIAGELNMDLSCLFPMPGNNGTINRQRLFLHNSDTERSADFEARAFLQGLSACVDGFLVHSQNARSMLKAAVPGISCPVAVSTPGVSLPKLKSDRQSLRKQYGLVSDKVVCGVFGIIHRQKGIDHIVNALLTSPCRKQLLFLFVGAPFPGPDEEWLVELCSQLNQADIEVRFTGRLPDHAFYDHMNLVDFAVSLRSVTKGESSAVLNQLLSHGVPTIISSVGSFAELPEDVVMHIPSMEESVLRNAIDTMVVDVSLRQAMSQSTRTYAETIHWPTRIDDYVRILEEAKFYKEQSKKYYPYAGNARDGLLDFLAY